MSIEDKRFYVSKITYTFTNAYVRQVLVAGPFLQHEAHTKASEFYRKRDINEMFNVLEMVSEPNVK